MVAYTYITFAKVMYLPLSVCLSVHRITKTSLDEFLWISGGVGYVTIASADQLLVVIRITMLK